MAAEALNLLQCLGYPSIVNFKEYLNRNLLSNSHITAVDVDRAFQIYGVPAPLLKGKKWLLPKPVLVVIKQSYIP